MTTAIIGVGNIGGVASTTIERLVRAAGFDPLKAGGVAEAGRIEAPGGDLHQFGLNGQLVDLDPSEHRRRGRGIA